MIVSISGFILDNISKILWSGMRLILEIGLKLYMTSAMSTFETDWIFLLK